MTRTPDAPPAPTDGLLTPEELQLAFRNRGMPLEAMRYDVTPTGVHYLVVHWDIPDTDPSRWSIAIGGRVGTPRAVTLDEIMARPSRTVRVTLECAGNGRGRLHPRPVSLPWLHEAIGTADWTGTPLWPLLEECALQPDAVEAVFTGVDHGFQGGEEQAYARSLTLTEARRPDILLAYGMNDRPLEPQHGSPLRLIVPGWYGMASVKWLRSIDVVAEPFGGFQQAESYRYRREASDPGEPVTTIRVRALMVPPGLPDFFSRDRIVDRGPVVLTGRAWSGHAPVRRVEVAIDGRWADADLGPIDGAFAWRAWSFRWDAAPGRHTLVCRATDDVGETQPLEQPWNLLGFGNNQVQELVVTVR